MEKKEFYRHALPHFQQPGQAYFVTWSLKDAIPPKVLDYYTIKLRNLQTQIQILKRNKADESAINLLNMDYNILRKKYLKAFDDLLDLQEKCIVNLSKESNREILHEALTFWEGKRIDNYAYTIMSNHVHWVFKVFDNDDINKSFYLQDILQSVKRFSATEINKNEGLKGSLWQKECFDTTIRDDVHLYNAINYSINNPVKAGLVKDWKEWKGTRLFGEMEAIG
jgi:REP element-mobilizing transposase RayT